MKSGELAGCPKRQTLWLRGANRDIFQRGGGDTERADRGGARVDRVPRISKETRGLRALHKMRTWQGARGRLLGGESQEPWDREKGSVRKSQEQMVRGGLP